MSLLTDGQIIDALKAKELTIDPWVRSQIQPASIDLHLGTDFRWYRNRPAPTNHAIEKYYSSSTEPSNLVVEEPESPPLDPTQPLNVEESMMSEIVPVDGSYVLEPGKFILACTQEIVGLSSSLAARIEGKSSLGRYGLIVHSTAGFVDPGFMGQLTLEMTNLNPRPIVLHPGMRIAQLSILRLQWPVLHPYGTSVLSHHYQNQRGAMPPAPLTKTVSDEEFSAAVFNELGAVENGG